jgi:hypothetical protein
MLDLSQFTGTTNHYRWSGLFRNCVLTDGTHYLAETAGAYWLMDAIASHQPRLRRHKDSRLRTLQFWTLKVDQQKHSAVLSCRADSAEKPAVLQRIEYTDFPLPEITIWVAVGQQGEPTVLMVPSEY